MFSPRFLYALCEPDSGHVRYIGIAVDPKARLRQHAKADSAVGEWIRNLQAAGTFPVMVLLIELRRPKASAIPRLGRMDYLPHRIAEESERIVIEYFHRLGASELLNVAKLPKGITRLCRIDGIGVDGEDRDGWLEEFKQVSRNWKRERIDIVDGRLVSIEEPTWAELEASEPPHA